MRSPFISSKSNHAEEERMPHPRTYPLEWRRQHREIMTTFTREILSLGLPCRFLLSWGRLSLHYSFNDVFVARWVCGVNE